jgi:predicted GNAT family acetyltransferase
MTDIAITRESSAAGGRYTATVPDVSGKAELTYVQAGPGMVIAEHTFTPPAMRERGIAKLLVERLVADARTEGFKIVPRCSYVRAQATRHPEWRDVIQA